MTVGAARSTMPAETYAGRLDRARTGLAVNGAEALLVGVGADLVYLTGYAAMPLERLTMLVLGRTGRPTIVAPRRAARAAASSPATATSLMPA